MKFNAGELSRFSVYESKTFEERFTYRHQVLNENHKVYNNNSVISISNCRFFEFLWITNIKFTDHNSMICETESKYVGLLYIIRYFVQEDMLLKLN